MASDVGVAERLHLHQRPRAVEAPGRTPFWMHSPRGSRASWLHLPPGDRVRSTGVVICPPVGWEYVHSHRVLRTLADRLADAGFPTLRFDYHGCGSSDGEPTDEDVVGAWLDDVGCAANLLRTITGSPPSLLGLRLGSLLALTVAGRLDIQHLVAWAPVASGRGFVREMNLAAAFAVGDELGEESIEAAGFVLTRETLDALKALAGPTGRPRIHGAALVIDRDDLGGPSGAGGALLKHGVPTDVRTAAGYAAMMEKPHVSVVPTDLLGSIVDWLKARTSPGTERPTTTRIDMSRHAAVGAGADEELLTVPGRRPLFGVLTTPRFGTWTRRPLLLLSNGGSAHSVGPNRVYVEIARGLASAGFATVRLDLANLGDSVCGHPLDENHPYPSSAASDIARAISWLRDSYGVERTVLGGICSGAYHAFVCGRDSGIAGLEGLLMINPLTFQWSEGDTLLAPGDARYHGSLRDPKKWKKLGTGVYDAMGILRFAWGAARKRGADFAAGSLERARLVPPRGVGRALLQIAQARRTIDFIFSRFDPGHGLLLARAGAIVSRLQRQGSLSITLIKGADHSFTQSGRRRDLVNAIADRLSRYPV